MKATDDDDTLTIDGTLMWRFGNTTATSEWYRSAPFTPDPSVSAAVPRVYVKEYNARTGELRYVQQDIPVSGDR